MSIATASHLEIAPGRPLMLPLVAAVVCVALADWLFYGWQIGISLALFFAVLGVVAVAGNGVHAPRKVRIVMAALFVAGLLALVEDVNVLSAIVSALGTALFVIIVTASEISSWQRNLLEAAIAPLRGLFQLAGDLLGALQRLRQQVPRWLRMGSLIAWIVPLGAFAVFLSLISSANPLIEHRLMQIDLGFLFSHFDPQRTLFWIVIACAVWPLIHRRIPRWPVWQFEPSAAVAAGEPSEFDYLLGVQAMLRSLVLFNALFALQTGLDLVYLWGGVALPDGMSYAEYAHRGAYPLIATALLAAGFVLIAMRRGGPAEQSRLIRPLVLAWTGQNILLVISSILRLDLYLAVYSLTYLRLAAFIWMGLVAAGLLLMLVQIIMRKTIHWLVAANAATLALVLYGCCFINAPQIIAAYNVEHCRETSGMGLNLDLKYLLSLGPQVLPILESRLQKVPALQPEVALYRSDYETRTQRINWRAWSFRAWRLKRYLSNNRDAASYPSKSSKG
jgi:hypothetical protein